MCVVITGGCGGGGGLLWQEVVPTELDKTVMYIMREQTSKDVAQDAIQSRLSRAILDNYSKFIDGMKFVQEVDLDITRAEITVGNILRELRGAKDGFVTNTLHLIRRRRRRERLQDVRSRLLWLKVLYRGRVRVYALCGACGGGDAIPCMSWQSVVDVEDQISSRLREERYGECVNLVLQCQKVLKSARAQPYEALKPLRERMDVQVRE